MSNSIVLKSYKNSQTEVCYTFVPNKLSDNELIELAKNGDESAFSQIINRYKNPIINYIFRMLNDHEEAVDLSQETFVRVYFALERYSPEYAFSTYIYRIATNLAISEIRKRKRRKFLSLTGLFQDEDSENIEFDIPDKAILPDQNVLDQEQKSIITKAITTLPEKYRTALILRDVQDKSYEEVSNILDLSLGTTKSRISRARALLKEKLALHFNQKNHSK
jgi:RNA polymerase sigma-70 factor (ECF subfamily)